jgi:cytochrome c oxidase subunit 2
VGNIFKPLSAPAESVYEVSLLALLVCAGIFVIVGGLLTIAITNSGRDRRRKEEPPQIYGSNQRAGLDGHPNSHRGCAGAGYRAHDRRRRTSCPDDALKVRVIGPSMWWEIHYPDYGVVSKRTARTVGDRDHRRPTALTLNLRSHSQLLVPQLAGDRRDPQPPEFNVSSHMPRVFTSATAPNIAGCSTPRCSSASSSSRLRNSRNGLLRPVVDDPAVAGRELFMRTSCVNCHRVAGTAAVGIFGPDLTRLMSRDTIASGAALNTPENLRSWMRDPHILKPGCLMPNMQLTQNEVTRIVAYLQTLK